MDKVTDASVKGKPSAPARENPQAPISGSLTAPVLRPVKTKTAAASVTPFAYPSPSADSKAEANPGELPPAPLDLSAARPQSAASDVYSLLDGLSRTVAAQQVQQEQLLARMATQQELLNRVFEHLAQLRHPTSSPAGQPAAAASPSHGAATPAIALGSTPNTLPRERLPPVAAAVAPLASASLDAPSGPHRSAPAAAATSSGPHASAPAASSTPVFIQPVSPASGSTPFTSNVNAVLATPTTRPPAPRAAIAPATASAPRSSSSAASDNSTPICYNCRQPGHTARNCKAPRRDSAFCTFDRPVGHTRNPGGDSSAPYNSLDPAIANPAFDDHPALAPEVNA